MTERRHAEQKDYEFDYRIVLPDGAIRHIHSLGHPVFDESGNLAEFLGMAMDVTERKQAEEQLREGARTLRLTTETIPHLIWSARPDGYIDYCNQRLLDFTGMTMAADPKPGWRLPSPGRRGVPGEDVAGRPHHRPAL